MPKHASKDDSQFIHHSQFVFHRQPKVTSRIFSFCLQKTILESRRRQRGSGRTRGKTRKKEGTLSILLKAFPPPFLLFFYLVFHPFFPLQNQITGSTLLRLPERVYIEEIFEKTWEKGLSFATFS